MAFHQRLFFLLLMLLPTQLGYHMWPTWAMVLGRRVDYLSPTVFLTDIVLLGILVSWFVESRGKLSVYLRFSLWKIVLIALFIVSNIFVAHNTPEAIYKWVKVLEFLGLGWYVAKTKPHLASVVFPLAVGMWYSSILAIWQFILQGSVGGSLRLLGERTFTVDTPGIAKIFVAGREVLRPYATFSHPNVLGGYLAILFPFLFHHIRNKAKRGSIKFFYALTIVLGLTALALTFSRSAWIAGLIGIVVSTAYPIVRKKRKPLFPFILWATLLVLLTLFLVRGLNTESESIVVRRELNRAALSLWQSSPLVGIGLGNFLVRLPQTLPSREIYFLQPVHNIYLLVLAETGILGLVVFAWFLWWTFRKSTKRKVFTFQLSLFILLLLGLVDHYPLTLQQGQLLLTLIVAMAMV